MSKQRMKYHQRAWIALVIITIIVTSLGVAGCQQRVAETTQPTLASSPETAITKTSLTDTATPSPIEADSSTEPNYALPEFDSATAVPDPMSGITLSDEVQVWVLLGSDSEPPFTGRIQAIHLLLIHPRFSKASLISIPGNLYVYIPGFGMQRLNTAYALGGIETMLETLSYNFGLEVDRFVLAHPGDFQWLVDDLDSINVTIFYPIAGQCGGIRAGLVEMDGALALCYASYLDGIDEVDRMGRQQQLLRVIFKKFTHESYLTKLPLLYSSYQGWVKTNISLTELMELVPLSLRLADPDRIGYYMIGRDAFTIWEVPGYSQAQVLLPNQEEIRAILLQAIDDIMQPAPLTGQVQTLEAQLTEQYEKTRQPSPTYTPTPTPIATPTPPGYP
ncbi:MAG: LCP family protein [Anaerolineaceae bacterium]|nr:LCP family protein [Anaerolineaceae bacterium]